MTVGNLECKDKWKDASTVVQGMQHDSALHMAKSVVSVENRTISRQFVNKCVSSSKTSGAEEQSTKSVRWTNHAQWGKKSRTEALMW